MPPMQELSLPLCPSVKVVSRASIPDLGSSLRESLKSNPEKMWDIALRNKQRLPDDLHEAMLLWSFDASQKFTVQLYLDWVGHCEAMEASREKFERERRLHDRILFGMMVVSYVALVAVLIWEHTRW